MFSLIANYCNTLWEKAERSGMMMSERVYHERQVRELCALHALNNLFQDANVYTKMQLDDICYKLSPDRIINPHKSVLGFGNYDINVIMAALQMNKCEAVWFDKRKDPSCLNLDSIVGFILNIPSECKIGFVQLPIKRKHWIAIRRINGSYYNLDSKLDLPELIGTEPELLKFLREQLKGKDREVFVVVTGEAAKETSWKRDEKRQKPEIDDERQKATDCEK